MRAGLTPDQQQKLRTLMAGYQPEVQAIQQEVAASGDQSQLRAKLKPLRLRMEREVGELMTPEQQASYRRELEQLRRKQHSGAAGDATAAR